MEFIKTEKNKKDKLQTTTKTKYYINKQKS